MPLVFDETRIDDPAAGVDPLRGVASAAAQVRSARWAALEAELDRLGEEGRPRFIVVVGSGTGAFAGDLLNAVLGVGCPIPVVTVRGYRLPGWVAGHDLVVAIASTSGHDEDGRTRVAAEAVRRGCRFLAIGPSGSEITPLAEQARAPYITLPASTDPLGSPWGPTVALLTAVEKAGLRPLSDEVYEAAATRLESMAQRCRPAAETWDNPAKSMVLDLAGALPAVWGTTPVSGTAAEYWVSRMAAVAGYPALCGRLPDVLYDQAATAGGPFGGAGQRSIFDDPVEDGDTRIRLVLLRDAEEPPETARDVEAVAEAARTRGVAVNEIVADPGHSMERLAGLIALTDYVTVYLAVAYGLDPLTHNLVVR